MRRIALTVAGLAGLAFALGAAAFGADGHSHDEASKSATVELTGEIVDIACYLRHDSSGPRHVKCATYCAGLGMPFGFLEAGSGRLYLLLPAGHASPTESLIAHIGKPVTVTGILTPAEGLTGLQITEVKGST